MGVGGAEFFESASQGRAWHPSEAENRSDGKAEHQVWKQRRLYEMIRMA